MSKLERGVHEFFERRLVGECIDTLPLTPEQAKAQKADWLIFERQVVVEVKDLVDDREDRARAVIDKWRARSDWPAVHQESDLQEVLRRHPQGRKVNDELFAAVTDSIDGAFEKANRQIRDTKRVFGIPNAQSLLVFVNESVDILDPKAFAGKLRQLFTKKASDGSPRFSHIDGVLIVTWAHSILGADGRSRSIIISAVPPSAEPYDPNSSLESFLMKEWAEFLRQPLEHGGVLRTAEDFEALRLKGKRPPPAL